MPPATATHCKHGHPRTPENQTAHRQCKVCRLAQQRVKRRGNIVHSMWEAAHQRCLKSGVEFTITESDIVVPEYCPVLGLHLEICEGRRGEASPSLDRVDNNLGYVPGNIQVISWRANRLKGDGTLAEHEAITNWMRLTGAGRALTVLPLRDTFGAGGFHEHV